MAKSSQFAGFDVNRGNLDSMLNSAHQVAHLDFGDGGCHRECFDRGDAVDYVFYTVCPCASILDAGPYQGCVMQL
jgi:hypothetical protein